MSKWTTLASHEDKSVNHARKTDDGGMIECRYVQRTEDYFIIYVSSHTGCALSCRFCHLTSTKQVMMTDVSFEDYIDQVKQVLTTYTARLQDGMPRVGRVHVNFMSRGEPLANQTILTNAKNLFNEMERTIKQVEPEAEVHFLLSSIVPKTFDQDILSVLQHKNANLYYSLYSLDPGFRKKWLPKASDPYKVFSLIEDYQKQTQKPIALHWALIKDQNDSVESARMIVDEINKRGLFAKFNLVRYNPFDMRAGEEASEKNIEEFFEVMEFGLGETGSQIVPRVGFDVKASCGMFLTSID